MRGACRNHIAQRKKPISKITAPLMYGAFTLGSKTAPAHNDPMTLPKLTAELLSPFAHVTNAPGTLRQAAVGQPREAR